jgi:aminopeptidase N
LTFGEPLSGKVPVAQRRFYLSPGIQADGTQKWTLPVCLRNASGGQSCELLTPGESEIHTSATDMFLANATGKGYYRIAYPAAVYASLVAHVETELKPTERISLAGDEWAQVRSGKATVGDYMNLVSSLKADQSAAVVSAALSNVGPIYSRIASTQDERDGIAAWLRNTISPEFAKIGPPLESDGANTREMRADLFGVLGYFARDPVVIAQANQIAAKYMADPTSGDATLGRTALSIAARNGTAELFDNLKNLSETSTNPEVQVGALRLLAQFENPELAKRSLDYALSGKVRNQDAAIQFAIAMQIDATRDLAWKYIQDHWDAIHALLTPELGSVLVGSTAVFCSEEARDQVQQFLSTHKVASADRAAKHAIERINGCIELRKLQEPNLKIWLEQHGN